MGKGIEHGGVDAIMGVGPADHHPVDASSLQAFSQIGFEEGRVAGFSHMPVLRQDWYFGEDGGLRRSQDAFRDAGGLHLQIPIRAVRLVGCEDVDYRPTAPVKVVDQTLQIGEHDLQPHPALRGGEEKMLHINDQKRICRRRRKGQWNQGAPRRFFISYHDELPEFVPRVQKATCQPIEDKVVTISRVQGSLTFPANFQRVADKNPCPCGC